jgi:hypothetical protein
VGRVALAALAAALFLAGAGAAAADVVARPVSGSVVLRAAPAGAVIARLRNRTEFGSPLVYSVVARRGKWLGVISAQRPNGALAWIDARTVRQSRIAVRIEISLSQRTLRLLRGETVLRNASLGIGSTASPTPTGSYAVTDRLAGAEFSTASYGCCILALTAHQERPRSAWPGGTRIAIHGGALVASSNGCLHAPEDALRFLMTHVPLGTRVTIRA